jgi:tetratricopeptide (TPR) repeat protein/CHAT domain-containing protein
MKLFIYSLFFYHLLFTFTSVAMATSLEIEQLHQQAKAAFFAADYPTAITKWQAALEQARRLDQKTEMSKFLVNLGVVHYSLGQYAKALDYYQQVLMVDQALDDQSAVSTDLTNLGLVYFTLGEDEKALFYYEKALAIQEKIGDQVGQANTLGNLALVYNRLGRYQEALEIGKQALVLHQAANEEMAISNDFMNLGIIYDNLNQYAKAIAAYSQALALKKALDDHVGIARTLDNLGTSYKNAGEYAKALKNYQQALKYQQQTGDFSAMGGTLSNLGAVYDSLAKYDKALVLYQKALMIQRQLNEKAKIASTLTNLGVVYDNLGQSKSALIHYQQALVLQEELADQAGIAGLWSNLGLVYYRLGEIETALDYLQRALHQEQALGNQRGEAQALTNLGLIQTQLGDYSLALTHYLTALAKQREIGDQAGIGNTLSNIGVSYYNLGHFEQALGYFLQAATQHQTIGDKRGESTDLGHIGTIHAQLGFYSKALTAYEAALSSKRAIKDKRGESVILSHLGAVHANINKLEEALSYFQSAAALTREMHDRQGLGADLANIGLLYQQLGQPEKAYQALEESVSILTELGTDKRWYAQRGLAKVQVELQQIEAAIAQYEQAIATIETLKAGLQEKKDKYAFMGDKLYVYNELISLLYDLHTQAPTKGYDDKALEIFERKQGRVFLEELGKSGAEKFASLPSTVIQQEKWLEEKQRLLQAELVQERNQSIKEHDTDKLKLLSQQLAVVSQSQQQLQAKIKTQYPDYYALKYPQPVTVNTIQQQVLQADEALLIYNVMAKDTLLWVVTPTEFALFSLSIGEEDLNDTIAYLRDVILNRLPELIAEGNPLYEQLIPEDAKSLLTKAHTLYIVPTGPLYTLPFEALVSEVTDDYEPHFLIQDYALVYLSSGSLLKILRDMQARREKKPSQPFIAFANPTYRACGDKQASERAVGRGAQSLTELRSQAYRESLKAVCFVPLPETEQEAKTAANLFGVPEKLLYMGKQARRSILLELNETQQLSDYRYLLFAAHGLLPNEVSGLTQSALVLSDPDQEGFLTAADAYQLQFNADFINLSACNTGGGKKIKGEGIIGLTRAFMYAGTASIGVTLWSVESASAENLSVGIFNYLRRDSFRADAFRQIKLDMIAGRARQPYYNHPYYWAPFVLYGEGR